MGNLEYTLILTEDFFFLFLSSFITQIFIRKFRVCVVGGWTILSYYYFNYVCTSPSFTILGVSCTVSGTRNGCTHLINLFLIPLSFSDVFFFHCYLLQSTQHMSIILDFIVPQLV